jgi:hypothetical protein
MNFNAMMASAFMTLVLSAPVPTAFAQVNTVAPNDTETQALTAAKVSAGYAVASAEIASGGKVVELSLDMEATAPSYRVTAVSTDGTDTNYLVDATTGKAILFLEAKADTETSDKNEGGGEGQDNGSETEDAN